MKKIFFRRFALIVAVLLLLNTVYFLFKFIKSLKYVSIENSSSQFINYTLLLTVSLLLLFIFWQIVKKYNLRNKQPIDSQLLRYRAISDATNDAVWDYDVSSKTTFYNNRIFSLFGYTPEDVADNDTWWRNNISPGDYERVKNKIDSILQSKESSWNDEYRFRCKDGSYKVVYDRCLIVRDKHEKPLRMIGAMIDITHIRMIQKKINDDKLKRKSNAGIKILEQKENKFREIKTILHEDIAQSLVALKMKLSQDFGRPDSLKMLSESISLLDIIINKTRDLSNQLIHPTLDYFGLEASLGQLLSEAEEKQKIITKLNYHIDEPELKQVDKKELLIFRITEAYLNIVSGFTDFKIFTITVNQLKNNYELIIENNGIPSSEPDIAERIKEIRNWTEVYNGKLEITSKEEKNQILTVII